MAAAGVGGSASHCVERAASPTKAILAQGLDPCLAQGYDKPVMALVFFLLVGPVAAFLIVVAVPRRVGFALALLVAIVAAAGVLLPPSMEDPAEAAAAIDLTRFTAIIWSGAVAVGCLLQAARPALRARGWAAYPLAIATVLLLLLGLTL